MGEVDFYSIGSAFAIATINIAESFSDFVKNKENSYRFQQIEKTERQQYQERERAIRQLSEQRLKSEAEAANRIVNSQPNREVPIE